MIDKILVRAEADYERATRRRKIAQALAEDWAWWGPLLGGTAAPVEARDAVAQPPAQGEAAAPVLEPSTAPQSACRQCGEPIPPRAMGGGRRPKVFCSKSCGSKWHAAQHCQRKKAAARREANAAKLSSEPIPDGERPLFVPDGEREDEWLKQQLAPPRMPWEQAPVH
jgi:hypothetical protein